LPIHPYVSMNSRVRAGIERFGLVGWSQKSQGDWALKVDGGDEQRETRIFLVLYTTGQSVNNYYIARK
jgi:hypothetical protein